MNSKKIALTFLGMLFAGAALAEEGTSSNYIGVNVATFDSKHHATEHDGLMLNLGVDLNNYFALELVGGASSTTEDAATSTSSKIDYAAGAFLRFNLRFDRVTVYALGGATEVKATSTTGPVSTTTTDSSGSYGYGIDFYGTRDLALSARRMEFFDNTEAGSERHLRATILGITYYFDTPKIRSRY